MPNGQEIKAAEAKKEEKKAPSSLENIVNETPSFLRSLVATAALATGFLYGSSSATNLVDAIKTGIPSASVVASQPLTSASLKDEPSSKDLMLSIYGLIQLPVFDTMYKTSLLNASNVGGIVNVLNQSIPKASLAAAGFTLAAVPLITTALYPVGYFFKSNYSLKGFGEELKKHYVKTVAISTGTFGFTTAMASGAAVMFPAYASYFLLPAAAVGSYFFGVFNSYFRKKPEERKGLFRYTIKSMQNTVKVLTYPITGALSSSGKLLSNVYTAIADLGSAITTSIDSLFKAPPKPAPVPAIPAAQAAPA